METSIVARPRPGFKALVARSCISGVLGLLFFSPSAWSDIVISPSSPTDGSYTVSWSSPLGCNTYYDDFYTPWDVCYWLSESGPTSGTWWSGNSLSFSGKPSGTYTYTVTAHFVSYYWNVDTYSTPEGPTSVYVCTTHTVPYYAGWAYGSYDYPQSGACSFYYEGTNPYPSYYDGYGWCSANFPVEQSGTTQVCN